MQEEKEYSGMTEKQIEIIGDNYLSKMIKEKPREFIMAMLIKMGQMCVEANAGTVDLMQNSTIEKQRYLIKCHIAVKKVKITIL